MKRVFGSTIAAVALVAAVEAGWAFVPQLVTAASAQQAPCTTGVHLAVNKTVLEGGPTGAPTTITVARVGDAVDFTVMVSLLSTDCPVSNATVALTLPNGVKQTLATGLALAPGGSQTFTQSALGLPLYIVNDADLSTTFPDTVTGSTTVTGTAAQTNGTTDPVTATTAASVPVIHPETTLTKSASPTSGTAPLTVTYSFREANVSPDTAPAAVALDAISGVTVTDSDPACHPTFVSGDTNGNGKLDVGETWLFQCGVTYSAAGSHTDTASATGTAGDGRPAGTPASDGASSPEHSGPVTVTVAAAPPVRSGGGGVSAPTTTVATSVPTATTAAPASSSGSHLAFTGARIGALAGTGAALLGGGGVLVVTTIRRRRSRIGGAGK